MLEKKQLKSFEALTTLLAFCYPIACELLAFRTRARDSKTRARDELRESLLECLRAHPKARGMPPDPTLQEALNVIAGLGGYIKSKAPPGWQTLASGYMELLAFERGWLAALASRKSSKTRKTCDQR